MVQAEKVVLERTLLLFSLREYLIETGSQMQLSGTAPGPLDLRQLGQGLLSGLTQGRECDARLFEERGCNSALLLKKGEQQVFDIYALMTAAHGMRRRRLQSLL